MSSTISLISRLVIEEVCRHINTMDIYNIPEVVPDLLVAKLYKSLLEKDINLEGLLANLLESSAQEIWNKFLGEYYKTGVLDIFEELSFDKMKELMESDIHTIMDIGSILRTQDFQKLIDVKYNNHMFELNDNSDESVCGHLIFAYEWNLPLDLRGDVDMERLSSIIVTLCIFKQTELAHLLMKSQEKELDLDAIVTDNPVMRCLDE